MSEKWRRRFEKLRANWTSWLAYLCLLGVLVGYAVPILRQHTGIYQLMCSYTAVLLLLEVKLSSLKRPSPTRYSSLADAQGDISNTIRNTIMKKHRRDIEIRAVGGRILTITSMLTAIAADIQREIIACKNVKFRIFCLDPDFLKGTTLPNVSNIEEFLRHMNTYAETIEQHSKLLMDLNDDPTFRKRNISFEVVYYRTLPLFYTFLIGNRHLFWGPYTWDCERNAFDGAVHACYQLDRGHEGFDDLYYWHFNRTELFLAMEYEHRNCGNRKTETTIEGNT